MKVLTCSLNFLEKVQKLLKCKSYFCVFQCANIRMCGKPNFGSDSVLENQTVQKFDMFRQFSDINCMQSAI